MPVSHYVDRTRGRDILFVTRSGTIDTQDESLAFQERDADSSVVPGIPVVVDCSGVNPTDSAEVVRYIVRYSMQLAQRLSCGPLAIVVNSYVECGMARMYQEMTEPVHANTEVFCSAQEAIDWLNSQIKEG